MPDPAGRRWPRWTITALLGLLAVNALVASALFIARPDGSAMGIPEEWLEGTPFASYLVPGIVLGLMGVLSATAATLQARGKAQAPWWSGTAAAGFVIWIAVQAALTGSTRHPMQTVLQASVLAMAIAVGLLSILQLRSG